MNTWSNERLPTEKRQILFVGDESFTNKNLHSMMQVFQDQWDVYFTKGGRDALAVMQGQRIDIMIADLALADMEGTRLLEIVRDAYPSTIRFVLSGNAEYQRILESANLAHQFINKPVDVDFLTSSIERSCRLRDVFNDRNLVQATNRLSSLPSLPALYLQLIQEIQKEEPTTQKLGDIVSQDTAMTAKILQLVNSAFFGIPVKVTSPHKAVTILGINTLKALVLGIHIFTEYRGTSHPLFSIEELWRHSLTVGRYAQIIAQEERLAASIQADAQIAGILHDVGKLVEIKLPGFFQKVKFEQDKISLASEYQAIGTSHAEIGAYLMRLWGLPEEIVEVVAYHHFPGNCFNMEFGLLTLLHVANGVDHQLKRGNAAAPPYELDFEYLDHLGIQDRLPDWVAMCKEASRGTGQAFSGFRLR